MATYPHDDLLARHFEKGALLGQLGQAGTQLGLGMARSWAIGKGLGAAERVAAPAVGQLATRALGAGGARVAGGAYQFGKGLAGYGGPGALGRLGGGVAGAAGNVANMVHGQRGPSLLGFKLGSDAGYTPGHRALSALSYGAFMLPYLSKRVHDDHALTTALNAAGLAGLGAGAARDLARGEAPAAYDLAGLGLMGAGLLHDHFRGVKHPAPPAP